jgi:polyketide biosynthesis enoyl-CoA hydratase PksH
MGRGMIETSLDGPIWRLRFCRPEFANSLTSEMVQECRDALYGVPESASIVLLEGSNKTFCTGVDLAEVTSHDDHARATNEVSAMYDIFFRLATGPFISVAHVQGSVAAGGVGITSSCDVVIASKFAPFRLSELLFGLYPACVFPFLIRRCGYGNANYLVLSAQEFRGQEALRRGLVDIVADDTSEALDRLLRRLRRLPLEGIVAYKAYVKAYAAELSNARQRAVSANVTMFEDTANLARIRRYVENGGGLE